MTPQSAKAKGRRLQQWVRDRLLMLFPQLEADDIRSTSMGAQGEDLQLSPAARKLVPFRIECKNRENINIWQALEQAGPQGLVVFKRNKSEVMVALPWARFESMLLAQAAARLRAEEAAAEMQALDHGRLGG